MEPVDRKRFGSLREKLRLEIKSALKEKRKEDFWQLLQSPRYRILNFAYQTVFQHSEEYNRICANKGNDFYHFVNDPVNHYLTFKIIDGPSHKDPDYDDSFSESLESFDLREMTKQTYEKYLSKIVGRPVTVEESELESRIGDNASLRNGLEVSSKTFSRLHQLMLMQKYFISIFSSDKYAYLEE